MARPASPEGARSALLSSRVTPKLMFGLEMMSRLHRSPIPDIVSRAIKDVFNSDYEGFWDNQVTPPSGKSNGRRYLLELLWADKPSDRFANVAFYCDRLMSSSDARLWSFVKTRAHFWQPGVPQTEQSLRREILANEWENIQEAHKMLEAAKLTGSNPTSLTPAPPVAFPAESSEPVDEILLLKQRVLSQKKRSPAQCIRNGRELQKILKATPCKVKVHSVTVDATGTVIAYIRKHKGEDHDALCSSMDESLGGHMRAEPYLDAQA